ncbi:GntR family transcriptional regulator [Diplocloster modestus]|uniref:GntR family transcriptional regulator n=1 Tax=Diplocloster modestus TaxID=2850322 RepID=A0ABS6KBU8_9FIRM|nr:GntR family transcriptional regulator [Diplocloster modestus]MBU9727994.1 GntR family transcriptional regulator [Diplocloster modestus]
MEKDIGLCDLIFDYYESKILFGYCKYGERLPSIAQLSSISQLGENTVRGAFRRLREKGYIQSEERKASVVTYRGTSADFEKNKADYFVPRKDGIRDFFQAARLLFIPIWETALENTENPYRVVANRETAGKLFDDLPPVVQFCIDYVFPLKNELLTNLYWECTRYVHLFYSPTTKSRIPRQGTASRTIQLEDGAYSDVKNEIFEFISKARRKYHLEGVEQIPFKWNVYRQRPQLRYTLAAQMISEIFWGRYPVGSFLPSLTEMAEQYDISLTTARRTVELLNSLGVTRSYHGSGTKVLMDSAAADLPPSDVREDLRLHRESLHLMGLTIRGVMLFTLESVPAARREKLMQELFEIRAQKRGFLCFGVILNFICENCPSMIVRECYSRLKEFIIWGCIMVLPLLKSEEFLTMHDRGIGQLEHYLKNNNLAAFADGCQSLMEAHLKNDSMELQTFTDDWQSLMEEKASKGQR